MNKKAQGMSINVIIVAAVALVVLVVLIAIFTGKIGGFSTGTERATEQYITAFTNDCHPSTSMRTSYASQRARLESEVASLEAGGQDASNSKITRDTLIADWSRVNQLCAEVTVQNTCANTQAARGSLSGNCEWK